MPNTGDERSLDQLIKARHACVIIRTREEQYARSVVDKVASSRLEPYWVWTCVSGVHPGLIDDPDAAADTEQPAAALYHLAHRIKGRSLCVMYDLAGHLEDPTTLRALRELIARFREIGSTLVLVDHTDRLPEIVSAAAVPLELSLPDDEELDAIVRQTVVRLHREEKIEVKLTRSDLRMIVRNLGGLTRRQAEEVIVDTVTDDRVLDSSDINTVLARKRQYLERDSVLEYIETPVDLSSIGGLRRLKRWLEQRRDALGARAREFGLAPPRGVLLLGVQGAGKSLCAKAIATAWHRPLLRLDPGALYDRFVGESERRLRDALHQAELMAPIVLWIDEIEKGFASAAARSADGGLSQRMFGTLLTWMQDHEAPVFLVATANNIEALPPELLRKGRFDEIFFVDLPSREVRERIFSIHLEKRKRDPSEFDLAALADAADGYSGAEIEQAIMSALHESFSDGARLHTERIVEALRASPPLSVTMAEHVRRLRSWANDRCVPADE